jgi:hypothetical protein
MRVFRISTPHIAKRRSIGNNAPNILPAHRKFDKIGIKWINNKMVFPPAAHINAKIIAKNAGIARSSLSKISARIINSSGIIPISTADSQKANTLSIEVPKTIDASILSNEPPSPIGFISSILFKLFDTKIIGIHLIAKISAPIVNAPEIAKI